MFFLGTISAVSQDSGEFDGSSTPDLALIDSEYRDVVWIDSKDSGTWDKAVYDQLIATWRANEGKELFFKNEREEEEEAKTAIDTTSAALIIPNTDH